MTENKNMLRYKLAALIGTVIMAIGLKPKHDMTSELLGSGIEVYTVGDGRQVGNIRSCTADAYEVARSI